MPSLLRGPLGAPVLQSKTAITVNQWGRRDQKRTYLIDAGTFEDLTDDIVEGQFSFGVEAVDDANMFVQQARLTKGGHSPLIDIVNVDYAGAIFPLGGIIGTTQPYFTDDRTLTDVDIFLYEGNQVAGGRILGSARIVYMGVDQEFHYMTKFRQTQSQFAVDPYPQPTDDNYVADPRFPIPVIKEVRALTNANIPLLIGQPFGQNSAIFPWLEYYAVGTARNVALRNALRDDEEGGCYDVTETVQIRIRAKVPPGITGYA